MSEKPQDRKTKSVNYCKIVPTIPLRKYSLCLMSLCPYILSVRIFIGSLYQGFNVCVSVTIYQYFWVRVGAIFTAEIGCNPHIMYFRVNLLIMGELLNSGWILKLLVKFWIMVEHLIMGGILWNFWSMGELLNYGWTFKLSVNIKIFGELLNYLWTFKILVNFFNISKQAITGELLNYMWTFKLWVNFSIIGVILDYWWNFEFWVNF